MEWHRDRSEILKNLEAQRRWISSSCEAYDRGDQSEAIRLANPVYVIVHHGGRDKSLLVLLGIRGRIRFASAGSFQMMEQSFHHTALAYMQVSGDGKGNISARYLPYLADSPEAVRWEQFHKWWEEEPIFVDGPIGDRRLRLTRKRLVFALRNQDGASHFEPIIRNPNHIGLAKGTPTTWALGDGDSSEPILGAEFAMMRQIAWELATTLDRAEIR